MLRIHGIQTAIMTFLMHLKAVFRRTTLSLRRITPLPSKSLPKMVEISTTALQLSIVTRVVARLTANL
jgi:hypothetical protein